MSTSERDGPRRLSGIDRGPFVTVQFDDRTIRAYEGETVAAALMSAGIVGFSRADAAFTAARLYCGMGTCRQCEVEVEGRGRVRSCRTRVHPGMRIRSVL